MMLAAVEGNADLVKTLLAKGADIDAENDDGDTALRAAKEWDHEEVIQLLKDAKKAQREGKPGRPTGSPAATTD